MIPSPESRHEQGHAASLRRETRDVRRFPFAVYPPRRYSPDDERISLVREDAGTSSADSRRRNARSDGDDPAQRGRGHRRWQERLQLPPTIVVFSLSGGTGKTSLVANLGRALALEGEEVLLIDRSFQEDLALRLGATRSAPGETQTVVDRRSGTRVQTAILPLIHSRPGEALDSWMPERLTEVAANCDRVLVDLGVHSLGLMRAIFRWSPTLLVPVLPDWNALLLLGGLETFVSSFVGLETPGPKPLFVLNQYCESVPLHQRVRTDLGKRLGERLLPLELHRSLDMDEALMHGLTVLEYEPEARISRDYRALAAWLQAYPPRTSRIDACLDESGEERQIAG